MTMATEQQQFDIARQWQEEFDNTLQDIGSRAMQPTLGQSAANYVRESMRMIKRAYLPPNHPLSKVNMRALDASAINPIWNDLKKAAREEAYNPVTVPEGEFREIVKTNPGNGQKIHTFIGRDCFVKFMNRPGRRVVSFRTPNGPVDASGRFLR
jgi:hypothetical protein